MWSSILHLFLIYISILFLWFVISTLAYFFALVVKKPGISNAVSIVGLFIQNAISFILGIYLLFVGARLLLNGQIFWFFAYLFIGYNLLFLLAGFIQVPFSLITFYYINKIEKIDFEEDIEVAEIIDEKNNIIGKTEGDNTIKIRMARNFIILYVVQLLSLLIVPDRDFYINQNLSNYIVLPFIWNFSWTFIIGIPYLIIHKIKYKKWLPDNKRYFFTDVWKVSIYVCVIYMLLIYVVIPSFVFY